MIQSMRNMYQNLKQACPALLFALVLVWQSSGANGQEENVASTPAERVTMKLRLDDSSIAKLKSTGQLQKTLPKTAINRIDAIRISRSHSFILDDLVQDEHVEKWRDTLVIHLNDAMLDRLGYQPLLSKIYYSNYSRIRLVYRATEPTQNADRSDQAGPEMFARIDQRRGISGTLLSPRTLNLTTDFGELEIEFDKIKGVQFHRGKSGQAEVWFPNGDRMVGKIDFDRILLQCPWGKQSVSVAQMDTLAPGDFVQLRSVPERPESNNRITKK